MDIKKIRNIILLILFIIIVIIILLVILLNNIKEEKQNNPNYGFTEEEIAVDNQINTETIGQAGFFVVSNCVASYLSEVNQNNFKYYTQDENGNYNLDKDIMNNHIYNLLSQEYIEKNNITKDNVEQFVPTITKDVLFVPMKIKLIYGEDVNQYGIFGDVVDTKNNYIGNMYCIVSLDKKNSTFSIEPTNKNVYDSDQIKNNNIRIDVKDNNQYSYKNLKEDYAIQQYYRNYKLLMLANPEHAFEFLDKEYKEKRFDGIEDFKGFVNNNREKIASSTLSSYAVNPQEGYAEYIAKDKNEEYYIFNIQEKNPSDYNVMLDTYIIGTAEFNEEYNKSNDSKKASINAVRIISAINDKNYYYVFNHLDENFKKDNFNNLLDFQEYINNNFFENNPIPINYSIEEQNDNFIYQAELKNDTEIKYLTIVIQLKEGSDFVMSFSIEQNNT